MVDRASYNPKTGKHPLGGYTLVCIAGEIDLFDKESVSEIVAELKHISAMLHKAATTIKQRITT